MSQVCVWKRGELGQEQLHDLRPAPLRPSETGSGFDTVASVSQILNDVWTWDLTSPCCPGPYKLCSPTQRWELASSFQGKASSGPTLLWTLNWYNPASFWWNPFSPKSSNIRTKEPWKTHWPGSEGENKRKSSLQWWHFFEGNFFILKPKQWCFSCVP